MSVTITAATTTVGAEVSIETIVLVILAPALLMLQNMYKSTRLGEDEQEEGGVEATRINMMTLHLRMLQLGCVRIPIVKYCSR